MQEHGNQKGTKPRTSKNEDVTKPAAKSTVRNDVQEHGNQKGTKPRTSKNEDVTKPAAKSTVRNEPFSVTSRDGW
ncbi:hypothetical protein JL475_38565 [Streptomyces sp. M2CJ-2]|uniref:hypothetical protein n=1 Tax=Streptomyces sp. M2CJ-2 TaxID=2803948 RepID=UPI0019291D3D|nr:hypothetical protein [Streptomyces sp. M2CJ-2]MBL3671658.1 hypothetical protein [Streptomyces sp. M2CJ-2]